ncbi:MAG: penicillin-binding protein [Flavobacteriaceae bacterium TMED200]|nr:penicillin-binding protein [Flavobacteriaceae bacterium]OUW66641.1 MAG: penicillin-binding protein [Flavobacteriaceae bacterium TMED200]
MGRIEKKIMFRYYISLIFIVFFAFILIAKLLYIQVKEGDYYRSISKNNTIKNFILEPSRGNIYSDDSSLLATTTPRYEIRWDSKVPSESNFQEKKINLSKGLSRILGKKFQYYLDILNNARKEGNRYLLISKNLSYSQYKQITKLPLFNLSSLKGGLIVESKEVRENPMGKICERTIGYEKKDPSGHYIRVGLEGAFSHFLKGQSGQRLKQKIANGQWKPINDNNEREPTQGYDIYSTINVNIQDITHHALLRQLEKYKADHGCAVVMKTNSGEIKSIVNLSKTRNGKYYEKFNYAVAESQEPGSTFKLMSVIATLENNNGISKKLIDTKNGEIIFYEKYKVRDSKKGGYGKLSPSKAFEVSSNTGIVKMVYENYKNNPKKFVDRLYNMGLNDVLGLSIKGEGKPMIPYPGEKNWSGISLPWMAFGYGIKLTPLQILSFYNGIANGGEIVKPRFIYKIKNPGSSTIKTYEKEVLNPSICSESTLRKAQKMMFNVIDKKWGTANKIKSNQLKMAGKTGTCQVDYTSEETQYVSSFVGYFPFEKPEYTCIVVINKPDKKIGYYGGEVAAPVFKEIAEKLFVRTPKDTIVKSNKYANNFLKNYKQFIRYKKNKNSVIPNLIGMPAMDAIVILEQMGLKFVLEGEGKVFDQSIKSGSKVDYKEKITLYLS